MENVKYLYCKERHNVFGEKTLTLSFLKSLNNEFDLYFKINHNIAEWIREETNFPDEILESMLSKDDVYKYTIATGEDFELILGLVVKAIEEVASDGNYERFYNHVLTKLGRYKAPFEFHSQMENEYGIKDRNIEWWVAHFFIGLSGLIFDPANYYDDPFEDGYFIVSNSEK